MATHTTNELREFHHFLGEKLSNGGADLSPEEALDEWRQLHPEDSSDDLAAIKEALDELDRGGNVRSVEEFDREFRQRHGLPPKA